jgi:hypothetical protein
MRKYLGTMLLAAMFAAPGMAYAGQGRIYREQRQDYNRWDRGEERFYRAYLAEHRMRYIEFRRLNRWQQQRYWQWRRSIRDFRDLDRRNRLDQRDGDRNRDWDRDRDWNRGRH